MVGRTPSSIRALCLLPAAIAVLLGGCAASPKPPPHRWTALTSLDHVPMQGLATVPRVVAEDRPIALPNLENEAQRDSRRRADMAAGAAAGAAQGVFLSLAYVGPICIVLPPLCLGVAAVGAAGGARHTAVVPVPADDANRLAAVFRAHATSAALREVTAKRMPGWDEQADEVRVEVLGAVMIPRRYGVTFRLVVQAQGLPRGKPPWKPSIHFVPFATRPVEEWLAADAHQLKADVQAAMDVLSGSIAPAYMPYHLR